MPPQPRHAGAGVPPSTLRSISSLGRASGRGLAAFAAGPVLAALAVPSSLAAQIRTARPRIDMTPESLTALRGVARTDPDIHLIAAYVGRRLAASDTPPQGTAGCACRAAGAGRGRSADASRALAWGLVMGVAARRRGRRLVVGAARTSGDRERRSRPVEGRPGRPLEGHARPHTR